MRSLAAGHSLECLQTGVCSVVDITRRSIQQRPICAFWPRLGHARATFRWSRSEYGSTSTPVSCDARTTALNELAPPRRNAVPAISVGSTSTTTFLATTIGRRTMYATERTINRPVRRVVPWSRSGKIDYQGVTNGYRHHPSYHSHPGFGGRVSNVGAQQELGVRTQRNRWAHCCRSDSLAPPWEALTLTQQRARFGCAPLHRRHCAHSATILCSMAICFHCPSSSLMRPANIAGLIASGSVPSGSSTGAKSGDAAIALIS
jgi:hypothetical protein